MTYGELLKALQGLTEAQLERSVEIEDVTLGEYRSSAVDVYMRKSLVGTPDYFVIRID